MSLRNLNYDTLSNNENLKILGYRLIRVDHSSNQKRGGSQRFSPTKSKQYKLFEGMFRF